MLPSGLAELIAAAEDLARFLTQGSHFNASMAKPSAFLPAPKDRETSVSRHGSEPSDALWAIGRESAGERKLYGAAIFKASDVTVADLETYADEPPDRHAVIRGWPWIENDAELQKAQQKERALFLASRSTLLLL